jgi:hypothetical protein
MLKLVTAKECTLRVPRPSRETLGAIMPPPFVSLPGIILRLPAPGTNSDHEQFEFHQGVELWLCP